MAIAYHTHTFNVQEATDEQAAAGLSREVFLVPANLPPLLAEKQGLNDALTSIAGLTTSADQMIYTTAADAYATTALTAYGRSIVGSIDASAVLTLLGAGTTGTALFQDETAADARTTLELGSLATLSTVSNTNWSGADLAIENGGTGASSADVARTNLGLGTVATQDGTAVPAGGTTGQVLAKASATDGDTVWTAAGTGDLISTNNGSDFADPAATLDNLGGLAKADNLAGLTDASVARTNLGLGTAAILNAGDASGNLKALNADGGFSFNTGANASQTFNVNPFGGLWPGARSAHVLEAESTSLLASPRFTLAVTRKSLGSTANGPSQSSYAVWLHSEKTDWLNTLEDGEVDTGYILVNQGRKGDAGGLLIGSRKVFGTAEDTGGILSIETSASKVDAAGTTTASLQAIMGFQPSLGGLSNGGGIGFSMEPRVGNAFAAFAGTERSDLTGLPKFKWLIAGASSRAAANIFAGITGSDHLNGPGRFHGTGSAGSPAFADISQANNGFSFPASNQAGIVTSGVFRLWATTTEIRTAVPIHAMIGNAIPPNGTTALGIRMSSTANFGIFFGSGAPTLSAAQGSLYLRSDGSTTTNRAYINIDGSTGWTALQTAA